MLMVVKDFKMDQKKKEKKNMPPTLTNSNILRAKGRCGLECIRKNSYSWHITSITSVTSGQTVVSFKANTAHVIFHQRCEGGAPTEVDK